MNRGKAIILCVKGKRSIKDGVRIAAAHIDSPRIDLKQRPVYEDNGLALFKTHYYGGIKKVPVDRHSPVTPRPHMQKRRHLCRCAPG